MKAITITRQVGSWGDYIGVDVAKTLNWRYLDRELVAEAAIQAGINEASLRSMEARTGMFQRVVDTMVGAPKTPTVSSQALRFSEIHSLVAMKDDRIKALTREGFKPDEATRHVLAMSFPEIHRKYDFASLIKPVVLEFADAGDVVLAGSGSQMILKDRSNILHCLVIAPSGVRIKAIMEQEGVSRKVADRRVKENDQARTSYFRRYFKVNWLDPGLYDLVFNIGKVTKELAAEMIVNAVRRS
jgi:cytidylate kinase